MPPKLLLVLAVCWLAPSAGAQNVRLSGAMVEVTDGDVEEFWVSSDGERAVFLVDPDVDVLFDPNDEFELHGVRTDGTLGPVLLASDLRVAGPLEITSDHARVVCMVLTAPSSQRKLLSLPLDGGAGVELFVGDFETFRLAAGSNRVLYTLPEIVGAGLFSVPIDGSQAPIQLSAGEHSVRWASQFEPTPDGQYAVYNTSNGIYVVPVDGSQAPFQVYSTTHTIDSFDLSPDGARVLFYQTPLSGGVTSLRSVPLDASQAAVLLRAQSVEVDRHLFTPDGARVVFLGTNSGQTRLFSVPIDGSVAALRLDVLQADGDIETIKLDPAGTRVVYAADQDTDHVFELYSVPVSGGQAPIKLNGPMVAGGTLVGPTQSSFLLASDGARVVYVADQDANDVFELYVAPIDGSASALKLSGALVPGGDVGAPNLFEPTFRITDDGLRVVYVADQTSDAVFELYGVPIDGSAPAQPLSQALATGGDVGFDLALAALGRVLYLADARENDAFELFVVANDGSVAAQRLNLPLPIGVGGDVTAFRLTTNQRDVVYLADQDANESFELFRAPVDGSSPALRLNPPFEGERSVYDFAPTPDGARVVYGAFDIEQGQVELFSAPLDGSGAEVKLSAPLALADDIVKFELSGARVLYGVGFLPTRQLFVVPNDGSQPAVQLDSPAPWTGIQQFGFSPDGTRVVYIADQDADEIFELYGVPSDASQPPTKLSAALVSGGDVVAYQFSPDSTQVVFHADVLTDGQFELFAVPSAGGTPVRLNRALVPGGSVLRYAVAPDSIGVVYMADGNPNDVVELFGVAFAAPSAFELSQPLASGGDVSDFEICADSSRVVFRADAAVDQRFELFSVPIDRSQPPVRLSGAFASGGSVRAGDSLSRAITIGAGSQRVLYRANPEGNPAQDFFSVAVDGSTPPVRLTRFAAGVNSVQHRLAPDGRWVVFSAKLSAPQGFELHRVPTDGSEPPMTLHPPLHRNGAVLDFLLTDRGRALYLADQRLNDVIELFSSVIRSPSRPVRR